MSVKKFAGDMKAAIEEIKAAGTATLECDNIIAYLEDVLNSSSDEPSQFEIERYKARLQNWVESSRHEHESRLEMFRSVITAGQGAIKSSFLLNGGAAIALLAFIGHLAQFNTSEVPAFAYSLLLFAFGVLVVTVMSGSTYLTQFCFASSKTWAKNLGYILNGASILLGIGSYGLFVWGLFVTYQAFLRHA